MRRRCCKGRGIRLRHLHQPLKKQRGAPRNAYRRRGGHHPPNWRALLRQGRGLLCDNAGGFLEWGAALQCKKWDDTEVVPPCARLEGPAPSGPWITVRQRGRFRGIGRGFAVQKWDDTEVVPPCAYVHGSPAFFSFLLHPSAFPLSSGGSLFRTAGEAEAEPTIADEGGVTNGPVGHGSGGYRSVKSDAA
jgi:hypothetical protein